MIALTITRDDIDSAGSGPKECPITRSAWREWPNAILIWTDNRELTVRVQRYELRHSLAPEAREFVTQYDDGRDVQPTTIYLSDEERWDRAGGPWQR